MYKTHASLLGSGPLNRLCSCSFCIINCVCFIRIITRVDIDFLIVTGFAETNLINCHIKKYQFGHSGTIACMRWDGIDSCTCRAEDILIKFVMILRDNASAKLFSTPLMCSATNLIIYELSLKEI